MSSSPHRMPIAEQRTASFIHQVQKGEHRHRWKHIKINIPPFLAASSLNTAAAAAAATAAASGLFSPALESVVATAVEPADAVAFANVMKANKLQSSSVACAGPQAASATLSEFNMTHLPHTPSLNGEHSDAYSEADNAFWSEADDGCSGAVYLANRSPQDSKAKHLNHQKNLHQIQQPLPEKLNKTSQFVQAPPKVSAALVDEFALLSCLFNFCFGVKIFCKPASSDFKETVTIYLLGIKGMQLAVDSESMLLTAEFSADVSSSKLSQTVGFFDGSSSLFQLVAQWFLQGFGAEMSCAGIPTNTMEEILKAHCFMNQGNKGSAVTVTLADFSSSKLTLGKREMQTLLYRLNESGDLPEFYCGTSFSILEWLQGLAGLAAGNYNPTVAEIASSTYAIHASGQIMLKQNITLRQFKTLVSFLSF
ncbi:hypothetical protein HDU78_006857 [Chytriomyces hyalinus]|nr:hypothetical protein HDU78_006857 [Chytriomyces hyalinus]